MYLFSSTYGNRNVHISNLMYLMMSQSNLSEKLFCSKAEFTVLFFFKFVVTL